MNKFWLSIGFVLLLGCASKNADQQAAEGLEASEASGSSGVVEQALAGGNASGAERTSGISGTSSGSSGTGVALSPGTSAPVGSKQREIYTATLPISSGGAALTGLGGVGVVTGSSLDVGAGGVGSVQTQYDQALAAYKQRNFAHSQQLFQDFVKNHPQSKLVPNALYWEAETLYARGKYVDAIFLFKEVQAKYAKNPKAPDALLKAAMSYKHLGDVDNANLHLQILGEDYPQSKALDIAKHLGLL